MRGSNRYITGKDVTLAAFAVTDWVILYRCSGCGVQTKRINGLCEECQKEVDAERELQQLMDEEDLLRGAGVEPPRRAVEQMDDAVLYGLDSDGLDYWD